MNKSKHTMRKKRQSMTRMKGTEADGRRDATKFLVRKATREVKKKIVRRYVITRENKDKAEALATGLFKYDPPSKNETKDQRKVRRFHMVRQKRKEAARQRVLLCRSSTTRGGERLHALVEKTAATPATHDDWKEKLKLVKTKLDGSNIEDRRAKHMRLDTSDESRQHLFCDFQEATRIVKPNSIHVAVEGHVGMDERKKKVVGFSMLVTHGRRALSNKTRVGEKMNKINALLDDQSHWDQVLSCFMKAVKATQFDNVREGYRLSVGIAELISGSNVHEGNGGMVYPRISSAHRHESVNSVLDGVLPLLSLVYSLLDWNIPYIGNVSEKLQKRTGMLYFCHRLTIKDTEGGPILEPADVRHHGALSRCHRMSFLFAAGKGVLNKFEARDTLFMKLNQSGKSLAHHDKRDAGEGEKLLVGEKKARAEGVLTKPTKCLQLVVVISHNVRKSECLAIIGKSAGEPTVVFSMEERTREDAHAMRMTVYSCDFSAQLHGNPYNGSNDLLLDDDAWMIRITPYVTVHGETW
eukprot:CAMPEP_0194031026 /NCGR_PEP_ID=MMETSP0009_2-20130614/4307_1 /TAXON_ID=210454 /ORGANISM="Grammatophora oceanica, Strain CCMP 410" /LENGTH=524 /DNA_ID=CAMNT_0038671081 /DNA_START=289 /DNA_END=1860 /DNA_ORIENTATION=+